MYSLLVVPLTVGYARTLSKGLLLTKFELLLKDRVRAAIFLQILLFSLWRIPPSSVLIGILAGYLYAKARRLLLMLSHWLGDAIS